MPNKGGSSLSQGFWIDGLCDPRRRPRLHPAFLGESWNQFFQMRPLNIRGFFTHRFFNACLFFSFPCPCSCSFFMGHPFITCFFSSGFWRLPFCSLYGFFWQRL